MWRGNIYLDHLVGTGDEPLGRDSNTFGPVCLHPSRSFLPLTQRRFRPIYYRAVRSALSGRRIGSANYRLRTTCKKTITILGVCPDVWPHVKRRAALGFKKHMQNKMNKMDPKSIDINQRTASFNIISESHGALITAIMTLQGIDSFERSQREYRRLQRSAGNGAIHSLKPYDTDASPCAPSTQPVGTLDCRTSQHRHTFHRLWKTVSLILTDALSWT